MSQPRSSCLFTWLRQRSQSCTVLKANEKRNLFFLTRLDWAWGCWVLSPAHRYRVSPHVPSFPSQRLRSVSTTRLRLHHVSPYADFGARGKIRRCPPVRTASTPYEQPPVAAATHRLATMLQWLPHHRSWAGSAMVGARRTPWPGTRWTPPLPPSLALGHFPPAGAPRCGVATRPATCAARWLRAQAPTCCLRHHLSAKAPLSAFARAPR
jgi:hypothetical protein